MKKNIKNKKQPPMQYAAGGPVLNFIEDPQTVLQQDQMAWTRAKTEGALDGTAMAVDIGGNLLASLLTDYANSDEGQKTMKSINPSFTSLASGGSIPGNRIVVEGGELLETANGDLLKMKGPKHEQGGIQLEIPQGGNNNVYSHRVKTDLKNSKGRPLSVAEVKENQEKKIKKYEEYIQKNPGDIAAKNTLERLKLSAKKRDMKSLELQEQLRLAEQQGVANNQIPEEIQGEKKDIPQAAVGISYTGDPREEKMKKLGHVQNSDGTWSHPKFPNRKMNLDGAFVDGLGAVVPAVEEPLSQSIQNISNSPNYVPPVIEEVPIVVKKKPAAVTTPKNAGQSLYTYDFGTTPQVPEIYNFPDKKPVEEKTSLLDGYTIGDLVGTMGIVKQAMAGRNAAVRNLQGLSNPETDTKHRYTDDIMNTIYAKEAINKAQRDELLNDAQLNSNMQKFNAMNNSSGIGVQMSNIQALQMLSDQQNIKIENQYAKAASDTEQEKAKTLYDLENEYLKEQAGIRERNEQRMDIANASLAQAEDGIGRAVSGIGKVLNHPLEMQMQLAAINAQSKNFLSEIKNGKLRYKGIATDPENKLPGTKADAGVTKSNVPIEKPKDEITVDTPVSPSDYLKDGKIYGNISPEQKASLPLLLQQADYKLNLSSPENIYELQKKIRDTQYANGVRGKNLIKPDKLFGEQTYKALLALYSGKAGVDPVTGIKVISTDNK